MRGTRYISGFRVHSSLVDETYLYTYTIIVRQLAIIDYDAYLFGKFTVH